MIENRAVHSHRLFFLRPPPSLSDPDSRSLLLQGLVFPESGVVYEAHLRWRHDEN